MSRGRFPRTLCSTVLLMALSSVPVLADTEVLVSGVLNADYLYNTDEEASAMDARLDLDLAVGPLTLGVVYRAYQLSDPLYNPADIDVPEATVKHRFAAYESGAFRARAGHFVSTFGHGLTLRSYEDVDLEYDTLLDGLRAEYDVGPVGVTALAGTVEEKLFGTRQREHRVRGVRVNVPVGGWAELAGSAVERAWTDGDEDITIPASQARFEDSLQGAELSLWLGPLTLAGEYAERDGENPVTGGGELTGYAAYATGTLELGWLTLFGEFKDYERFEHYLVSPPTAVRDHAYTLMNRATYQIKLDDERGFLVEGSAPVGDVLFLTGGASEARNHDGDLSHWEIFSQVDHSFAGPVTGGLGWSWSREYELGAFTEHMTGAADVYLTLGDGRVVETSFETQRAEDPAGVTWNDYLGSLTVYPGTDITLALNLEATTDETQERDVWTMVEVRALLPEDVEASFSMGTERGGKKCSGGVCYYEPEFEGARIRLAKYF
ncbi:MAG: DUF6029 family protein [Candidatus Eisenbacteria bacterium]